MSDEAVSASRPRLAPERLFSCAGQVAIVTGGGSGIGLACAEALAAAGARVVIAGLGASRPETATPRRSPARSCGSPRPPGRSSVVRTS